jgi:hypothetical protein
VEFCVAYRLVAARLMADRGVLPHGRAHHAGGGAADLVGVGLDAELVDVVRRS